MKFGKLDASTNLRFHRYDVVISHDQPCDFTSLLILGKTGEKSVVRGRRNRKGKRTEVV